MKQIIIDVNPHKVTFSKPDGEVMIYLNPSIPFRKKLDALVGKSVRAGHADLTLISGLGKHSLVISFFGASL